MKYGYIRVSTETQEYFRQQLILKEYGVQECNIFEEKISGTKKASDREAFKELLNVIKENDEIVFESMSRMARSMQDLIDTTNKLVKQYKTKVVFLKENITVGGTSGDNALNSLIFNIMGAFAQFERDLLSDRTKQGIRARRELIKDFKIGRPREISQSKETLVLSLKEQGKTFDEITKITGVSRATACRICKRRE